MKKEILCIFAVIAIGTKLSASKNPFINFLNFGLKSQKTISYTGCYTPKNATKNLTSITAIGNGSWQNEATWSTRTIPTVTDNVTIPQGITVSLSGVVRAKSITIEGILEGIKGQPENSSIDLETEMIMVMGSNALLEIGTKNQPYIANNKCKITLVGKDNKTSGVMGDNFIGVMNGGSIKLHGKEKVSWTHLGAKASVGATQINLSEAIDWEVGDEIVIVSSRTNPEEAEKRTITAISTNRKSISFAQGLKYPHFSDLKTYTRATDNKTWTADLRAEVGLLSHTIKIQGDASGESAGFGGHIMAMMNSTLVASNIELYRMGQKAKLGKYPWHWHLLHEFGKGQYIKNSSIHQSFNRAITIHGTSYTTLDNNFIYDHIGHGVFLEDGTERFNVIKNNVALLTKKPIKGEEVTPSDNQLNEVQNRTPATYWITNPNNTFQNNVAAGTLGTGYWFAFPQKPMGDSASDPRFNGIEPYKEPLGLFKGNKTHSSTSGVDVFDQLTADHSILSNRGWKNSSKHLIENCTWYSNKLGIYSGLGNLVGDRYVFTANLIFQNNILIDNETAIQFASFTQVQESVIVADSGTGILTANKRLYRMYDGAGQIRDSHLVGWNSGKETLLSSGGAATKNTNHRFSGITTASNRIPYVGLPDYDVAIKNNDTRPQNPSHPRNWITVVLDEDGSLTGKPNTSIVSNHPFMLVGDENKPSHWIRAFMSPHKFVSSVLRFPGLSTSNIPNITCRRTKPGTPIASAYHIYGFKTFIQFPFITNENFQYTYTFEKLPTTKQINISMENATIGDNYILRFKDFAKLGGLSLLFSGQTLPERTSLTSLRNANANSFFREPNGDLYVKFVATRLNQTINMSWSTNFIVPLLDTDQDFISDHKEIQNGTNPFSDDGTTTLNTTDYTVADNEIILSPNPASNYVTLSGSFFTADTKIQLFNTIGKVVLKKEVKHNNYTSNKIDVSDFPKGIYLLVLRNDKQTLTKKILVD